MFEAFSDISIQLGEILFCCCWLAFLNAGPVCKPYYEWNGSNCLTKRTSFWEFWKCTGRRSFLSCITFELCYLDVLIAVNISIASALLAEAPQPLHLLLSSNDPIGLERAKLLAENLLDTISAECGASR